jgi:hypothetical protein
MFAGTGAVGPWARYAPAWLLRGNPMIAKRTVLGSIGGGVIVASATFCISLMFVPSAVYALCRLPLSSFGWWFTGPSSAAGLQSTAVTVSDLVAGVFAQMVSPQVALMLMLPLKMVFVFAAGAAFETVTRGADNLELPLVSLAVAYAIA